MARLEALTTGLLDLSRLEAGASQPDGAPVDVANLARQASEPYASRTEQAGLSFSLQAPEEPLIVIANASQLARALGNLLDNALKFTPEGGAVSLQIQREGSWVTIVVEDTGIGIPEGDLPQLFNRFHRGGNAAAYPGNGLGLATVRAIAEGHRGEVKAENTGCGARLTLRLPVDGLRSIVVDSP